MIVEVLSTLYRAVCDFVHNQTNPISFQILPFNFDQEALLWKLKYVFISHSTDSSRQFVEVLKTTRYHMEYMTILVLHMYYKFIHPLHYHERDRNWDRTTACQGCQRWINRFFQRPSVTQTLYSCRRLWAEGLLIGFHALPKSKTKGGQRNIEKRCHPFSPEIVLEPWSSEALLWTKEYVKERRYLNDRKAKRGWNKKPPRNHEHG